MEEDEHNTGQVRYNGSNINDCSVLSDTMANRDQLDGKYKRDKQLTASFIVLAGVQCDGERELGLISMNRKSTLFICLVLDNEGIVDADAMRCTAADSELLLQQGKEALLARGIEPTVKRYTATCVS